MSERHLSDGELVRILDREAPGEPAGGREDHLHECGTCRSRLEALRRTGDELAALLAAGAPAVEAPRYGRNFLRALGADPARDEAADPDRPHRPVTERDDRRHREPGPWTGRDGRRRERRYPAWLAGAVAATLAAVVLMASPAGAWLVERVRALLEADAPAAGGVAVPAGDPASAGTELAFRPGEGATLRIDVDGTSLPGAVAVTRSTDAMVVARIPGAGGSGEIMATPGGLRVRGGPGDTLAVSVPRGVDVEITVDGRLRARREAAELEEGPWVLPLDGAEAPGDE